jgi:hypothetical protein
MRLMESVPPLQGSCNTPFDEEISTRGGSGRYLRHGFDDVTIAWDISTPALDGVVGRLHELPGTGDMHRPGKKLFGERDRFGKWSSLMPRAQMLVYTVEGQTGTIRRLHVQYKPAEVEGELCAPELLGSRLAALDFKLAQLGLLPPSESWIVRTDVAVDVAFDDPQAGKTVLDGLRAVRLKSRAYVQTFGQPVTTVAFKVGKQTRARAYCRNANPAAKMCVGPMYGELRLETQAVWSSSPADKRIGRELVENPVFAEMIWEAWYGPGCDGGSGTVTRIEREAQTMKLVERVKLGEITYAQMERMTAFLDLERLGLAGDVYTDAQLRARRKEARELRLSANDAEYEPVELELGNLLHPFHSAWAA